MRADRQTAGYGRRGRAWSSPHGNLAATLLWPLGAPLRADGPAGFGFAAALAVRDACVASGAAPERLTLKWPNDVLLDGAKLAGLLIELLDGPQRALALGIGVNLASAPEGLPYRAAALHGALVVVAPSSVQRPLSDLHGGAPGPLTTEAPGGGTRSRSGTTTDGRTVSSPSSFLALLDAAFLARIAAWRAEGFDALRTAWLAAARGVGARVTVRLPDETLEGVFEALGPTGALRLRADTGLREITAGDVFFPGQSG